MKALSHMTGISTIACCALIGGRTADAGITTKAEVYATRGERNLGIHLHFPEGWNAGDKRPGIIFFFGGGWSNGSPDQFLAQAEYFASRGMVAARADYRVKSRDGVTPDECVRDARSAMRWMKKNAPELGIDPEKIISSGGSAGGHLAACLMIEDSVDAADDDLAISTTPAAMILFNPVMTFENPDLLKRLKGREDLARKISPNAHLNKSTPPSLILFGSKDRLIALTDPYWQKAETLGVRAERYIAEGKGHGFFNKSPWRERTLIAADQFLASLGLLEGSPTLKEPIVKQGGGAATSRRVAEQTNETVRVHNSYLQKKQHYMRQFDMDGDGKHNLAEFTEMTRSEFEKKDMTGYEEAAKKRFAFKDANKDGFVTPEEMVLSLVKVGYLPPEAAEGIVIPGADKAEDANNNGVPAETLSTE